jgi:hypothetical protein
MRIRADTSAMHIIEEEHAPATTFSRSALLLAVAAAAAVFALRGGVLGGGTHNVAQLRAASAAAAAAAARAREDAAWAARWRFRAWDAVNATSPSLCVNAQRALLLQQSLRRGGHVGRRQPGSLRGLRSPCPPGRGGAAGAA